MLKRPGQGAGIFSLVLQMATVMATDCWYITSQACSMNKQMPLYYDVTDNTLQASYISTNWILLLPGG